MREVKVPIDVKAALGAGNVVPGSLRGSIDVAEGLPCFELQEVIYGVGVVAAWRFPGDGQDVENAAALESGLCGVSTISPLAQ